MAICRAKLARFNIPQTGGFLSCRRSTTRPTGKVQKFRLAQQLSSTNPPGKEFNTK